MNVIVANHCHYIYKIFMMWLIPDWSNHSFTLIHLASDVNITLFSYLKACSWSELWSYTLPTDLLSFDASYILSPSYELLMTTSFDDLRWCWLSYPYIGWNVEVLHYYLHLSPYLLSTIFYICMPLLRIYVLVQWL